MQLGRLMVIVLYLIEINPGASQFLVFRSLILTNCDNKVKNAFTVIQ